MVTEIDGKKDVFFGCMTLEILAHTIGKLLGLYTDNRLCLRVLSFFRREMGRTPDITESQLLTAVYFLRKIPIIMNNKKFVFSSKMVQNEVSSVEIHFNLFIYVALTTKS